MTTIIDLPERYFELSGESAQSDWMRTDYAFFGCVPGVIAAGWYLFWWYDAGQHWTLQGPYSTAGDARIEAECRSFEDGYTSMDDPFPFINSDVA